MYVISNYKDMNGTYWLFLYNILCEWGKRLQETHDTTETHDDIIFRFKKTEQNHKVQESSIVLYLHCYSPSYYYTYYI